MGGGGGYKKDDTGVRAVWEEGYEEIERSERRTIGKGMMK